MATTPVAAQEAPVPINHLGRLFGVLFSPGKTFSEIVQRPSWLAPTVVLVVLSLVASILFVQRVDWREVISQQIEKSPQAAQLSAEQKEQRVEAGAKIAPIFGYVGGLVAPVVILLLTCLVMWGAYSVLSGVNPGFLTAFSISAHSFMTALVSTPIFLLVIFLKPRGTIDIENPVATNLAAFLPEESSKWLMTLCKQFDIFTIWTLILLAIGFAAVNPKRLKTGKAIGIALTVWLAYVVVRTGIAWVMS
jgi:hypothetical protein